MCIRDRATSPLSIIRLYGSDSGAARGHCSDLLSFFRRLTRRIVCRLTAPRIRINHNTQRCHCSITISTSRRAVSVVVVVVYRSSEELLRLRRSLSPALGVPCLSPCCHDVLSALPRLTETCCRPGFQNSSTTRYDTIRFVATLIYCLHGTRIK